MAGLDQGAPLPTEIKLHQKSRMLEIAFDNGRRFEFSCEFLRVYSPSAEVRGHGARHVCVTGGEPLAQPNVHRLLVALCDAGHAVSLETSGALDAADVDPRVVRVLDVKTPASGESSRNLLSNFDSPRELARNAHERTTRL